MPREVSLPMHPLHLVHDAEHARAQFDELQRRSAFAGRRRRAVPLCVGAVI